MNDKSTKDDSEIVKTLGLDKSRKRGKWVKRLVVLIILAVAAAFAWPRLEGDKNGGGGMRFTTRPAEKGGLTVTVTASGTLEPTNQVDVGSELSGIVKSVEADYNDPVKKKQVLAVLDTSKLQAQVLQSRASLESAKAKVLQAEATIEEATRQLERPRAIGQAQRRQGGVAVRPGFRQGQPGAGGRRQGRGRCLGQPGPSLPRGQRNRPFQGGHLLAHRRRGAHALRGARPDRRRFPASPGALHHRRGLEADGTACGRGRGRRRQSQGGTKGGLLCGRLPGPRLSRQNFPGSLRRGDRGRRGDLRNGF